MTKTIEQKLENKTSIFLIDDDFVILELFSQMLDNYGYEVRTSTNGKFAIRSIQQCCPDLVILDMKLPDMSGIDVYQSLQADAQTRNIPVIFLSGVEPKLEDEQLPLQGCDYLIKPIDFISLLSYINQKLKPLTARK